MRWGRAVGVPAQAVGRVAARAGEQGDAGETLVELLATIVILGIGVTAILGSIMMGIRASAQVSGYSGVGAALRSYGEALSAVTDTGGVNPYQACAKATTYPTASALGVTTPPGLSVAVTGVTYWNGKAFAGAGGTLCPSGATTDLGLQRVTLTATAPVGNSPAVVGSIDVVVRRPCAVAPSKPGAC